MAGTGFSVSDGPDGALRLRGELDFSSAPVLESALVRHLEAGGAEVDLSDLAFIDSSGIRVLVLAHKRTGRRLVLRGPPDHVRVVLDVTGMERAGVWTVEDPTPSAG